MRQALIGQAYYLYTISRLTRVQHPGYYLDIETATSARADNPNVYISHINVISYDGGRSFHRINIAGESEQDIQIIIRQ